ncbi:hypothetical protein [Streptomyces lydicus]|uniref:hypothetical protein n=1 Tax=Streptomyces lydicus TaxID=47763 RepID=UPI0010117C01|nr:hypothetical protein [Streptomyces lydicus]MCZ1009921.1 hypothetical protein [Streptomyces lydicus]
MTMQDTARTAAEDLRIVLDHWQHMRDLIDTTTPAPWPPAMRSDYLRALDEHDAAEVAAPAVEREHLVLAEQPAPLRLHVVDACRSVEVALCSVADEIAADVQRAKVAPPRRPNPTDPVGRDLALLAARDEADPQRWHYNVGGRSAPRAAAWLLARLTDKPGPCLPINGAHRDRISRIAREAARRIERTIGIEQRRGFPMEDRPCPWCGATLTMHRGGTDAPTVTCENGIECGAPVQLLDGRRTWAEPHELATLEAALDAGARRRKRAADRRRQRAAAKNRDVA